MSASRTRRRFTISRPSAKASATPCSTGCAQRQKAIPVPLSLRRARLGAVRGDLRDCRNIIRRAPRPRSSRDMRRRDRGADRARAASSSSSAAAPVAQGAAAAAAFDRPVAYVAIDISREQLRAGGGRLSRRLSRRSTCVAVCADYIAAARSCRHSRPAQGPARSASFRARRSAISRPAEAIEFLRRLPPRRRAGRRDAGRRRSEEGPAVAARRLQRRGTA